jgi:hypothetical protein
MSDKLKVLTDLPSWEDKERLWDERAEKAKKDRSLKGFQHLPKMVGIASQTAKFLKLRGLLYLIFHDKNKIFLRFFFKKPISYGLALLRSYRKKKSFLQKGDFFFYGIKNEEEFLEKARDPNALVIVGFSYCHKPMECPSGRFSDRCENDPASSVCNQCFIGKCSFLAKQSKAQILYIPTIHYIGEKMFEAVTKNPGKSVLFLITACELSLTMFSDWGNMIQSQGIGVRLDGRICNTMQAFSLSEEGIKPGLTVVLEDTKQKMLSLLQKIEHGTI